MTCRSMFLNGLAVMFMVLGMALRPCCEATDQIPPASPLGTKPSAAEDHPSHDGYRPAPLELMALVDGDLVALPRTQLAPDDPCLPPLYKDWHEFAMDSRENDPEHGFVAFRILLDRSKFRLNLVGLRRDGYAETLYRSPCGLGEIDSPTPEGRFIINHIYTYPDAAFFGPSGEPNRGLYNGFFAPLLLCDETGTCRRHRELGIHGFNPSAHPAPRGVRLDTCGPVSSGCVRIPDPCKFKSLLIRLVGIGPAKKNDRGAYHWLDQPVQVIISGDYPDSDEYLTLVSILEKGFDQVRSGLSSLFGILGP